MGFHCLLYTGIHSSTNKYSETIAVYHFFFGNNRSPRNHTLLPQHIYCRGAIAARFTRTTSFTDLPHFQTYSLPFRDGISKRSHLQQFEKNKHLHAGSIEPGYHPGFNYAFSRKGENGFESIPDSIYWAIVTITTVGYGDISPVTPAGKFIASIMMFIGYGIIAVPTGIISTDIAMAARKRKHGMETCPGCGKEGHDKDAEYCKFCGTKL